MRKINCWEYMKCGKGPGDDHYLNQKSCPAAVEWRFDGIHGGKNAGRTCWVVPDTLCEGNSQGSFDRKFRKCISCDFYRSVKAEERENFTPIINLLLVLEEGAGKANE